MLLVEKKKIKFLDRKYQKLLHITPVLNNSVCFAGIYQFQNDCLTHMGSDGKVIDQIIFKNNFDSFAALSDREVMVLDTRGNCIFVWNLELSKKMYIPFSFKTFQSDQSQIFIFPETNLVCIIQNGRYNNNTFKLSYFRYPLVEDQQPLLQYESEEIWNYEYIIRKGNNHSMICWFKGRHDDGFQFRTFDLRDIDLQDPNLKEKTIQPIIYKFPNDLGKEYGNNPKVEVAITNMWEMTPKKFMLICITSLSISKDKHKSNSYVYEASSKLLRPSRFIIPEQYNELTIDQYSFGSTCMIRTFNYNDGKPLQTPVYYISNETEEIVFEDKWQCSYLHKYDFTGCDGNLILEYLCENSDVKEITILAKKIMEPKEIYVHFLLCIYPEWDEDILSDASALIADN